MAIDKRTRDEIFQLHAGLCKAIADPKRLLIINELRGDPRTVGQLAASLGFHQSNMSQHLGVLRERGVVRATRRGNSVVYQLENPKIVEAIDLLREAMAELLEHRHVINEQALLS